jgi:hypothetical protein
MKKLSTYLFLILFGFSAPSFADDIRDFQIEGMSVGDSLLDYMTEDEINNSKKNYTKSKRYYITGFSKNLEVYDSVDIYLKYGDKNYKIKSISAFIFKDKKKCTYEKNKVVEELRDLFRNSKEVTYDNVPHSYDKTAKSKQDQTAFLLKNDNNDDHIRIECTDWSKKIEKNKNWQDTLSVTAYTKEILNWFIAGYN